jgi:hypothetical protein
MFATNVWCVENNPFEEFAFIEDFQDFEQQQELGEGKSLLHSSLPTITCI